MMNTEISFDHLNVINSILSLAYNLESYPNHLYRAGYKISRIEPQFNVNGLLKPDILFISEKYGLFCEAKSGEFFLGSNLKLYNNITTMHLIEKGIDIPTENLELEVSIFGKENLNTLKDRLQKEGITYPQIIIDNFIQKIFGNNFKDSMLNDMFLEPVKIEGKPLEILKFSEDSSFKKIAPYIFNTLMAKTVSGKKSFTSRELAEDSIEDIWDNLDSKLKKILSEKVRKFLKYCKDHELKSYLNNRKNIWTIEINDHWKSRKKFSDDCSLLMLNLDQKTLWDFFEEEEEEEEI